VSTALVFGSQSALEQQTEVLLIYLRGGVSNSSKYKRAAGSAHLKTRSALLIGIGHQNNTNNNNFNNKLGEEQGGSPGRSGWLEVNYPK
jgi:hypothetical protein